MRLIGTLTSLIILFSNISCTLDGSIENLFSESEALLDKSHLDKVYAANSNIELRWKVQVVKVASQIVRIEHSRDGGVSWSLVDEVPAALERYSWNVPDSSISQYKARATYKSFDGTLIELITSDNIVIDAQGPLVSLLSPLGGEVLKGGALTTIQWQAHDESFAERPISISYSTDNGTSWESVVTNIENVGSYHWRVPNINSDEVRVKVVAVDSLNLSAEAISTNKLSIDSSAPVLSLLSPIGGELILGDSKMSILWTAGDAHFPQTPIKIEMSADGGVTWNALTPSTENDGSFEWTVGVPDTLFAKIRITATDSLGHFSQIASENFTVSRSLPKLTIDQNSRVYTNSNFYTFSGSCDLSASMVDSTITVSSTQESTTIPCVGVAPLGTWTFTTSNYLSDGERVYSFSQTNSLPLTTTASSAWVRDNEVPVLTGLVINNGDEYASTPFVSVSVNAFDNRSYPLKLRLIEVNGVNANCEFSAGPYYDHTQATGTYSFALTVGYTDKKICGWVEDQAGNRSVMAPVSGSLGVNAGLIKFETGSPPQITYLKAFNPLTSTTMFNPGDSVKIEWTISDAEGLSNKPVNLEYTQDGTTWLPIVSAYGNLSGNPKLYSGSYSSFSAPGTGFFQIRLKATDYAGNNSMRITSDALNSGAWSIFAGNLDDGLGNSALGVSIANSDSKSDQIAIHPRTGDIYAVSDGVGLLKIDIRTGIVTKVISWATNMTLGDPDWSVFKIPENGESLPAEIFMTTYLIGMNFDSNGRLYLNFAHSQSSSHIGTHSTRIYQIDLDQKKGRWYAGGGDSTADGISPRSLSTIYAPIAFDESNSLYTMVLCNPRGGTSNLHKLVKITQTPEGLPDKVQHIAGNCAVAAPVSGTQALNTPFFRYTYANYGSLTVWDNGNKIYYSTFGGPLYKIINGVHYATAITAGSSARGVVYNPISKVLHISQASGAADLSISNWSIPTVSQAGGEVFLGVAASGVGTAGDCLDNGISKDDSCIVPSQSLKVNSQGKLIFTDGFLTLAPRPYRIRYVDDSSNLQTIGGSLPFYGKDFHKSVMKTSGLGSIFYKKTTEENSIYTPGLYFVDSAGQVFGRIDNLTQKVEVLWGNQQRFAGVHPHGTLTSSLLPMGTPYANDGQSMSFDGQGLPWIRYKKRLVSLSATGHLVERQTTETVWTSGAVGASPSSVGLHVYGLHQNIFFKNQGVFLMGGYHAPANLDVVAPLIRLFDFGGNTIKHILGGPGGRTPAIDSATPTDLSNQNLSSVCINQHCSLQFVEGDPNTNDDDRLYYTEGRSVRVISNPTTPGAQTLKTLFTETRPHNDDAISEHIGFTNFIVTPDQTKIFYVFDNQVYCRSLIGTSSWCNGGSLGLSPAFGTIMKRANQFTMVDSNTLLLNTGRIILQFQF